MCLALPLSLTLVGVCWGQVAHSFRYPAPITSLGMSPDSRTLAVGMANGMLSVKQLKPAPSAKAVARGSFERPLYIVHFAAQYFD